MIGIDEVGRGCWAGPLLVVTARTNQKLPVELKDSKLMTKKQREEILNTLSILCQFGEGWVTAEEIDREGLGAALQLGVSRALKNIKADYSEEIIMDGKVNYVPKSYLRSSVLIDADRHIPVVSAASVYAKVMRDDFMAVIAKRYPNYGFENHVGYGTKAHLAALNSYGVIKQVHRQSFSPIAKLSGGLA